MSLDEQLTAVIEVLVQAGLPLSAATKVFEEKYLGVALRVCRGNITRAARALGVHRNTIHNKRKAALPFAYPSRRHRTSKRSARVDARGVSSE